MLEFLCWFKGAMKVAIIGVKMHNQMRMVRPMYFSANINNLQIAHMYIKPPPPPTIYCLEKARPELH